MLIIQRIADLKARLERSQDERVHAELQRDLRYWSTRQITAEVVPLPADDRVELSTRVTILMKGRPRTFQIVGDDEADPAAGLISFNAPLSRAIAGAEPGDVLPLPKSLTLLRSSISRSFRPECCCEHESRRCFPFRGQRCLIASKSCFSTSCPSSV